MAVKRPAVGLPCPIALPRADLPPHGTSPRCPCRDYRRSRASPLTPRFPPSPGGASPLSAAPPGAGPAPAGRGFPPPPASSSSVLLFSLPSLPPSARGSRPLSALLHPSLLLLAVPPARADVTHPLKARAIMAAAAGAVPPASS